MNVYPTIIVPGIGQSKVDMADYSGNSIKRAWPFDVDAKAILGDLKGSLTKMMLFRKDAGFSDKVAKIAKDITDPLATSSDGTSKNKLKTVFYPGSVAECSADEKRFIYKMVPMEDLGEAIGEDRMFYFAFNPFGEVYEIAEELDKYVASVKEKTGSEKVNFVCVSLGGVVLKAYLQKYSDKNDVSKVVNIVSALDGTSLAADFFERKLYLDNPTMLLNSLGGKAAQLSSMIGMVPKEVMNATIEKSLNAVSENLCNNCTMIWGAVPAERFDGVYNKCLAGKGKTALEEKVKSYHEYAGSFPEIAAELANNGMEFYQLCGYNREILPVVHSKCVSSDSVIDVKSASLGASAANAGLSLSEKTEYTSPDGNVDASGCAFPERTWFFKNQRHDEIAYNDVALSLVKGIIMGEVTDIHSSASFPQFNGTRDIKTLKYKLVPEAKGKLNTVSEDKKSELEACLKAYGELLEDTLIKDNSNVASLENRFKSALENT